MVNAFVNPIVFVRDLDKSKRFYTDILGIKVKQDLDAIGWQKVFRFYDPDRHIIEFGEPENPK